MLKSQRQGKRTRLASHEVREVKKLLDQKVSQVEIKKITGISRMTIYKIKNGLRKETTDDHFAGNPEHRAFFNGPVERCPGCGRKVHMPCLACKVDSLKRLERDRNSERDRRQKVDSFK
ncbi:MAG: hypothetical protein COA78_23965 [Blastopirellula sp.]|nr:MAG: hypothetical protein COA78_23965 [Blastopirellula sp.]